MQGKQDHGVGADTDPLLHTTETPEITDGEAVDHKKKKKEKGKGKAKLKKTLGQGRDLLGRARAKFGNIQGDDEVPEALVNANAILYNLQRVYHYYCNTIQGQVIVDAINDEKEDKERIDYNTKNKNWRPNILRLLQEASRIIARGHRELNKASELEQYKERKEAEENPEKVISERVLNELIGAIRREANTIKESFYGSGSRLANTLDELSDLYDPKLKNQEGKKSKKSEKKKGDDEGEGEKNQPVKLPHGILVQNPDVGQNNKLDEKVRIALAQVLVCTDFYLNTSCWQGFNKTKIVANPNQGWADAAKRLTVMILRLYMHPPENAARQLIKLLDSFASEIRDGWFGKNSEFATVLELISISVQQKGVSFPEGTRFKAVLDVAPSTKKAAEKYIQNHIVSHAKDIVLEYRKQITNRLTGTLEEKKQTSKELKRFIGNLENTVKGREVIPQIKDKFNQIENDYASDSDFLRKGKFGKMRGRLFEYMTTMSDELFPEESKIIPEKYTMPKVK
jgi:hypothetical protein